MPLPATQASWTCVRWVPVHIASSTVGVGQPVGVGQQVATVGDVGTDAATTTYIARSPTNGAIRLTTKQLLPPTWTTMFRRIRGRLGNACRTARPLVSQWIRRQTPWSGWREIPGGSFAGSPSAVSPSSSTIEVYTRGTDDKLYENDFDGTSWASRKLVPGNFVMGGSPTALKRGAQRRVYVRGTDGAVYENVWTGTVWAGWNSLGGNIIGDVAAIAPDLAVIALYARGTNNRLYQKY
jgi:hypothetical protein